MVRARSLIIPVIGVFALLGAGCGSDNSSEAPKTVVQTVTGGGAPPASTTTAAAPTTAESTATSEAPVDDSFAMPNEVGKNLQQAQDDVQKVSGNPLFQTTSEDATGAGRFQVLDRNWTVCAQNVAPGTKVDSDSSIEFSVVKDDETCP